MIKSWIDLETPREIPWSDRVTTLAVISVPFGPAVDEAFDRFIDNYIEKY